MKKRVLLSFAILFGGLSAMAQQKVDNRGMKGFPEDPASSEKTNQLTKQRFTKSANQVSGWYEIGELLDNNQVSGSDIRSYASFITADSSPVFISSEGNANHWFITSMGHVADVSDPNWVVFTDYFKRKDTYTWDSLGFLYIYRRGTTPADVVDTLYIDLYDRVGLSTRGTFQNSTDVHARPAYSGANRRGTGYFRTITVLLTPAEETNRASTGWSFGTLTEAVQRELTAVNDNTPNMMGFTLHFRPGSEVNMGDTMEFADFASQGTATKLTSYFGYRMLQNEGTPEAQITNGNFYNLSLEQRKEQTNGGAVNGWTGWLPGNAFFERRYLQGFVHVSGTSSVSIDNLKVNEAALGNAYPNPAQSLLNVDFALATDAEVKIALYDMLGNQVKVMANGFTQAGEHTATINVNDLKAGIYMMTLTSGSTSVTKKVTVVK